MTMRKAVSQFQLILKLADTLSKKEQKAIHRATTGFEEKTLKADKEFARSLGLDPDLKVTYTHANAVNRIRTVVQKVSQESVINAFVVALDPAHTKWRAVLQAWAACTTMPAHKAILVKEAFSPMCKICGVHPKDEWEPVYEGLSVATRGSASGLETVEPFPAAMLLEWFLTADVPEPRAADWKSLREVFRIIDEAPSTTTANQLGELLKSVVPGDKYDRKSVVETLGYTGLLVNAEQPGDLQQWTNWRDRAYGNERNQEMAPPACGWRREAGLDVNIFKQLFPKLRMPKGLKSTLR